MLAPHLEFHTFRKQLMQRPLISLARRAHRTRGFTLVEVMVVVVIIGFLTAMAMPAYRRITMRSKMTAVVADLRAFSTAFITYNLQNGKWPDDAGPSEIPLVMAGALPTGFTIKSPIGGAYKWSSTASEVADGIPAKAAIVIETVSGNPVQDDPELWEMIDREMDDGALGSGNIRQGDTNSLVFVIEK